MRANAADGVEQSIDTAEDLARGPRRQELDSDKLTNNVQLRTDIDTEKRSANGPGDTQN